MSEEIYYGVVCWFNSGLGYGFIKPDNGDSDIFVHWSDVVSEGFKTLQKDQKVSYEIGSNNAGRPKAVNVVIVQS